MDSAVQDDCADFMVTIRGNHDTHRFDFIEQPGHILEGTASCFVCNGTRSLLVYIRHTDELDTLQSGIVLCVIPAEMSDPDHTDFDGFHLALL